MRPLLASTRVAAVGLAATLLAACPKERLRVDVVGGAGAAAPVFRVTRRNGAPFTAVKQVDVERVERAACGVWDAADPPGALVWRVRRPERRGWGPAFASPGAAYPYGAVPTGWRVLAPARPLAPGCYTAGAYGDGGELGEVEFLVDSAGAVTTAGE